MNTKKFRAIVLTLFPEMFPGTLGHSLAGKALQNGFWSLDVINIRDFAEDKHRTVDDTPYGGGAGMVLKPDVVHKAIEHAKAKLPGAALFYTTPRGIPFTQQTAESIKKQDVIILCGRFEGVDQRVIDYHNMQEISLGDFVLSGGEIAAQAMLDAAVRLLPGVVGNQETTGQESFACGSKYAGLLEYPQYTRPLSWNGHSVPDVLCSGNHKEIENWRLTQAQKITATRRPDLMEKTKVK